MSKLARPLSDAQIKGARPGVRLVKLYDGHGLYLDVHPTESKAWRFRYRQASGKETTITLGPYPELSLADARDKRTELRRVLLDGGDPLQHREQVRRASMQAI